MARIEQLLRNRRDPAAAVDIVGSMATITRTTVEVKIGEYTYRAELDGNNVELYRDGFPATMSEDARDALSAAIRHQLGKAWRARPEHGGGDDRENAIGPRGPATGTLTPDAANRGQMGNEAKKPSRQGEKEVGTGGPG